MASVSRWRWSGVLATTTASDPVDMRPYDHDRLQRYRYELIRIYMKSLINHRYTKQFAPFNRWGADPVSHWSPRKGDEGLP